MTCGQTSPISISLRSSKTLNPAKTSAFKNGATGTGYALQHFSPQRSTLRPTASPAAKRGRANRILPLRFGSGNRKQSRFATHHSPFATHADPVSAERHECRTAHGMTAALRTTHPSAAPRRAAAGVALQARAVPDEREVLALAAGFADIAAHEGRGAAVSDGSRRCRSRRLLPVEAVHRLAPAKA
jgi:hypothetical protein